MLTAKEFSILKACLQFAQEELGPHCPDGFRNYLPEQQVSPDEIRRLADMLNVSRMFYARVAAGNLTLVDPESVPANSDISQFALVLVPESDRFKRPPSDQRG